MFGVCDAVFCLGWRACVGVCALLVYGLFAVYCGVCVGVSVGVAVLCLLFM